MLLTDTLNTGEKFSCFPPLAFHPHWPPTFAPLQKSLPINSGRAGMNQMSCFIVVVHSAPASGN